MSQTAQVVDTHDLDITLRNLGKMEEAAQKYYRPAMSQATSMLHKAARPKVPVLTGRAQRSLTRSVTGKGLMLTGYVGWKRGNGLPWYINVVEYGASPHTQEAGSTIRTRKGAAQAARREASGEQKGAPVFVHYRNRVIGWRTIKKHPGFPARKMLTSTYEDHSQKVADIFAQANDQIITEVSRGA